jgi:hypothetical protein
VSVFPPRSCPVRSAVHAKLPIALN